MKKLTLTLLALTTTIFAHEKEIALSEIHEALAPMNDMSSLIIKVNPGDVLPIHFQMSGNVLQLEHTPENGTIKAREPLYIKIEPFFLFSQDKKEWKSFESYFTGILGVSVGSKSLPSGEIFLDLNRR